MRNGAYGRDVFVALIRPCIHNAAAIRGRACVRRRHVNPIETEVLRRFGIMHVEERPERREIEAIPLEEASPCSGGKFRINEGIWRDDDARFQWCGAEWIGWSCIQKCGQRTEFVGATIGTIV